MLNIQLDDAAASAALGARIARAIGAGGCVVFLEGSLGAGKTTLARGLLRELGIRGAIRSPSYTLLEVYRSGGRDLLHLDLYRLSGADAVEELGLRELLGPDAVLLVEWPGHGAGALPAPDLRVQLDYAASGRRGTLDAGTPRGREVLAAMA